MFCFYMKRFTHFLSLAVAGLLAFSLQAQGQTTVRGSVTDGSQGGPFAGVSVVVEGSSTGAMTDMDGKFSVQASKGSVLLFSFLGYSTERVVVSDPAAPIKVTLKEDVTVLDEIVVVGYGVQKKSDVTGAVATIDTKKMEKRPTSNIIQAMQGAVAGLNISVTGTDAEGSSTSTVIRGGNSISASNKPLIILDGVPFSGSWSEINPNDVASIEVLKDASSAAIYGARGANGVIMIQTKKGKEGDKTVISYSGQFAIDNAINIPDLMDGETFYAMKKSAGWATTATEEQLHRLGESTDWLSLALRTGTKMQHNLSIRGAGKHTRYYISGNATNNVGIARGDKFDRYGIRVNLEQDLGKWVKFGTSTNFNYIDRSGSKVSFSNAYTMNPLSVPYMKDGSLRYHTWEDNNYSNNPLSPLNEDDSDITRVFSTNNYVDVTFPIKGLTYKLNTNYSFRSRLTQNYKGQDTVDGYENGGVLSIGNDYDENWLIENILSYKRDFGKHSIFLTGLYSAQSESSTSIDTNAQGFPNDVMTYWQTDKATSISTKTSYIKATHISQMLRANYSYDSRYLFTATVRRDGFSAFGTDRKYGIFPSVAAGWNIANESFFKNGGIGKVVDKLKLRLTWGRNGNEAIDSYATLPVLNTINYLTDSKSTVYGFYPSQLASPDLGWETTESTNLGLDFSLWNGRLTGSVDAYVTSTTDLLLERTIPSINGTNSLLQNIGKTKGSGIELQLSSINITTDKFYWSTDLTLQRNKTVIVDVGLYDEEGNPINDVASGWFIGYPIDVNYDYVFDGIQQVGETVSYYQPLSQAGYVKYKDLYKDNVINANDKAIIGSREPALTFSMNNTWSYGNLSLTIFLNGSVGAVYPNYLLSTHTVSYRQNQYNKNFWTEENPNNVYPMNTGDGSENTLRMAFYRRADYLRIKDVDLSYKFDGNFVKKIGCSAIHLSFNVKNLFTFTNWEGLDPEYVSSSSKQRSVPQIREYLLGLKVEL